MRRGAWLLALMLLGAFLAGCVSQHPVLTGEPTPPPTPTPEPEPLMRELAVPTPALDMAGSLIVNEAEHYDRYVTYRQMRVYEYELGTLLDGIAVNGYPEALSGAVEIDFVDGEGTLLGSSMLHTAEEADTLILQPGENRIYAEIDTDMDIQEIDFTLAVKTHFQPVVNGAAGE